MRQQQHATAPIQRPGFAERHRAARDAALTSQRGRLVEAMVESVDRKGYPATTLTDIVARARVSRSTFYDHFANKEECFAEAAHTGVDIMTSRIVEELAQLPPETDAVAKVESIVVTFCRTVAAEPDFARLVLVESFNVNQAAVGYRDLAVDRFAQLYQQFYDQARIADPTLPELSDDLIALIPDAIGERTRRVIISDGPASVPRLAPLFVQFVVSALGLHTM
ncbi:TetR/AcrR family transcriptional regulator [Nocardia sp. CNY236]|uniref:TetR/AcrR family transcriptional regulator n=1 Tax=Nocardia sp. CNY236 TaxID=1169152 RepID=UPI00048C5B4F|nr:TetR/AcrR family transcriptional regulator [Nocardia sp. CNY236]